MKNKQAGSRVGAILQILPSGEVEFLGYGVYDGDFVPPVGSTGMLGALADAKLHNPRITLDNGKVVWGAECWWGPEAIIKVKLAAYPKVTVVDIDDARNAVNL